MSLNKVTTLSVVKKQYISRLSTYSQLASSLLIIQFLGILFSMSGVSSWGGGSDYFSYQGTEYSASLVTVFTMIWALMIAILLTSRAYQYDQYAFISDRLTSHLSHVLILLTASIIGGITALLSQDVIYVMVAYFYKAQMIFKWDASFSSVVCGGIASSLYIFLAAAVGYFIGAFIRLHKVFILILPACYIGFALFAERSSNFDSMLSSILWFYDHEHSILLFLVKILCTSSMLFFIASFIVNLKGVRE